jgi:hypothetical protein
MGCKKSVMKGK